MYITSNMVKLIRRHKNELFSVHENGVNSTRKPGHDRNHDNTHANKHDTRSDYLQRRGGGGGGDVMKRDANGFPLDRSLARPPDERVWSVSDIEQFDTHYTW